MSAKSAGARPHANRQLSSRREEEQKAAWPDTRLVRECLRGNEDSWSALIDKYKNLIFSIPIKYGFSPEDATDIFQAVCLELVSELPKLRRPKALPKWILQVTSHKCFHHKRRSQRMESSEPQDEERTEPTEQNTPPRVEEFLKQAQQEQALREAMRELPPRCRELIRMLFFEEPARPYEQLASELGLATGSIGFIRQRCLDRLRKQLREAGFS